MEKIVERGILYDFYGSLLTEHQQSIYEDAVLNDMSLSELAEEYGISRQGIHDLIKRCDKILQEYEDKLHLVDKFEKIKTNLNEIDKCTNNIEAIVSDERLIGLCNEISNLKANILEEL